MSKPALARVHSTKDFKQNGGEAQKKHVKVQLHSLANLPSVKRNGLCDPYVIVSVGQTELKSQVHKNNKNPDLLGETFLFQIENENNAGVIKFDIWNKNFILKHVYIGSAAIQINTIPPSGTRMSVALTQCNSLTATIDVTVECVNFQNQISSDTAHDGIVKTFVENPQEVVLKKIKQSLYAEQFKTQRELDKFASYLSDATALKNSYLNVKWANTAKFAEEFKDDELSEQDIDVNLLDTNTADKMLENRVTVKIVIIDQDRESSPKKMFREFASPLLSSLNILPQMGFFHSALMIGPWLIEWNNSSLCVPRKCLSRAAMLSADVDAITTITDLNKLVDDLSNAIVDWNTRVHYSASGGDGKTTGNCQQFVESLCSRIGVEMPKTGPLAKCLKDLRMNGKCKLEFRPSKEFRQKFGVTQSVVSFPTHKDLDIFVRDLMKKDFDFPTTEHDIFMYLKSIDRAFWLRHYKIQEMIGKNDAKIKMIKKKMEPLQPDQQKDFLDNIAKLEKETANLVKESVVVAPLEGEAIGDEDGLCECPFKDPMETSSIIFL